MKNIFFTIALLLMISTAKAQITKIDLQASGLTCSMCNKSIYKSLLTITNIDKVESDLNNNTFTIYFKEAKLVNIDELKNKVEVAGYKVANLWLYTQVEKLGVKNDTHTEMDNQTFHFMDVQEQELSGLVKLRVVDKGFLTTKQYKAFEKKTTMKCFKSGFMEDCCTPKAKDKKRIYHVTL
jgi:copper chaperone CopZ